MTITPQGPKPKVCWHHGNLARLQKCLSANYCDHYLWDQGGQKWWVKLGLKAGDVVQFSVKGKIVAKATVKSEPYDLKKERDITPIDPKWPGAVDVADVQWYEGGTCRANAKYGSHKL